VGTPIKFHLSLPIIVVMTVPLSFTPSPASVPPANVVYRLKEYPDTPVNRHPLVDVLSRLLVSYPEPVIYRILLTSFCVQRKYTLTKWHWSTLTLNTQYSTRFLCGTWRARYRTSCLLRNLLIGLSASKILHMLSFRQVSSLGIAWQ